MQLGLSSKRKGSAFVSAAFPGVSQHQDAVLCTVEVSASTCGIKEGKMKGEEGFTVVKTGHTAGP